MKSIIIATFLTCFLNVSQAQKVKNSFFTLHNIIRGDSVYNTFDKQVNLIKTAGFDAIEINQVENFEGMKSSIDKFQFAGAYFYVKLKLEEPYFDQRLADYIQQLKGTNVIIAPFIVSESKRFKPSSHDADTLVIRLVNQIADMAKKANLQVAMYPHVDFYVETTDHALSLVKQINRKNVGLTFNLCHWLATTTTTPAKRLELRPHLKVLLPYLKMITICGANDVITSQKNIWNDYILPLGTGSFDTYNLVEYMVKDLKFKKPIGVQCYNIKGNKPLLIQNTISVWNDYKSKLEAKK
jgi:sugar phosphate isomerase/epimerase